MRLSTFFGNRDCVGANPNGNPAYNSSDLKRGTGGTPLPLVKWFEGSRVRKRPPERGNWPTQYTRFSTVGAVAKTQLQNNNRKTTIEKQQVLKQFV